MPNGDLPPLAARKPKLARQVARQPLTSGVSRRQPISTPHYTKRTESEQLDKDVQAFFARRGIAEPKGTKRRLRPLYLGPGQSKKRPNTK